MDLDTGVMMGRELKESSSLHLRSPLLSPDLDFCILLLDHFRSLESPPSEWTDPVWDPFLTMALALQLLWNEMKKYQITRIYSATDLRNHVWIQSQDDKAP